MPATNGIVKPKFGDFTIGKANDAFAIYNAFSSTLIADAAGPYLGTKRSSVG